MGVGYSADMIQECRQVAEETPPFEKGDVDIAFLKALPMEDGLWCMAIVDGKTPNKPEQCIQLMCITDEQGEIVGASLQPADPESVENQAQNLFFQCMSRPHIWKPRRPRYLGFRNDQVLTELPLKELNVERVSMFTGCYGDSPLPAELQERRACTVCEKRADSLLFQLCPECQSVFYCSDKCQQTDLHHVANADHSHSKWCGRLAVYSMAADKLADLPFTFIKETSAEDFTPHKLKAFLKTHGVLKKGYWRWEYFEDEDDIPPFGDLPIQEAPYVLAEAAALRDVHPGPLDSPLTTWEAYYNWRGFQLESPIATLLQWPLTLYHILTNLMPCDYPEKASLLGKTELTIIHLIGVEKEADLIEVFMELGELMPSAALHIVMVGPDLATTKHNTVTEKRKVKVTLYKGLYQDYTDTTADVVIGLNAGLAAYPSWVQPLKRLKADRQVAYFTDYCQYSSESARLPMKGLKLGSISDVRVNPFRSPLRRYCEEHRMPWYSNGFIYHLVYDDTAAP